MVKKKRKDYIVNLSIKHSVVTQFTSFIAVEKRDKVSGVWHRFRLSSSPFLIIYFKHSVVVCLFMNLHIVSFYLCVIFPAIKCGFKEKR